MPFRCNLCPHKCLIEDNKFGICGVRGSKKGQLFTPFHGRLSAVSIDPIEKKPLFHYFPSYDIFSIGFYGCNLRCPFCQNYQISKEFYTVSDKIIRPSMLVKNAVTSGSFGIAYTYSEPIVHFEYIIESSALAAEAGLKNILITNGFINQKPGTELLKDIDAVNIDLKAFNDHFYKKTLGGRLQPVLDFISSAAEQTHIEVTTLVIPDENDSKAEIEKAAGFIASIDKNIPYHLSAYYPSYNYTASHTRAEKLLELADVSKRHLNFVFTGNIHGGLSDTFCPECGTLLIRRNGYSTRIMTKNKDECHICGLDLNSAGIIMGKD